MLLDYFRISLNGIRHRKRRTLLTVIGVVIGVLAIVSLVSIGQGLKQTFQERGEAAGSDTILLSVSGGHGSESAGLFDGDDIRTVRSTRGVETATPTIFQSIKAEFQGDREYVNIRSSPLGPEKILYQVDSLELLEGRLLRSSDTNSVVIVESVAEDKFEEEIDIRDRIKIRNRSYTVVGIGERKLATGTSSIYMTEAEARRAIGRESGFGSIAAKASGNLTRTEERLQRNLRELRGVEEGAERFETITFAQILDSLNSQLSQVQALLLGIGSISIGVGAVGITNTMYTSVIQRTHEIGVMKSVGATKKQIMTVFLFEAGLIGALGGLIGSGLGVGVSTVAARLIEQQLGLEFSAYVSPLLFAGGTLFGFLVGSAAGAFPAKRAAGLKPAEALEE